MEGVEEARVLQAGERPRDLGAKAGVFAEFVLSFYSSQKKLHRGAFE